MRTAHTHYVVRITRSPKCFVPTHLLEKSRGYPLLAIMAHVSSSYLQNHQQCMFDTANQFGTCVYINFMNCFNNLQRGHAVFQSFYYPIARIIHGVSTRGFLRTQNALILLWFFSQYMRICCQKVFGSPWNMSESISKLISRHKKWFDNFHQRFFFLVFSLKKNAF